ncbi:MAG: hypothetical protein HC938_09255, partial [Nitrospira sp.]|nr:hypothetical protein [Nitrospira sp.]
AAADRQIHDTLQSDETDRAESRRLRDRAQPESRDAGTDQQDFGPLELELPLATDILKNDVSAVALDSCSVSSIVSIVSLE